MSKATNRHETRPIVPLYRYLEILRHARSAAEALAGAGPVGGLDQWVDVTDAGQLGAMIADVEFRLRIAVLSVAPDRCERNLQPPTLRAYREGALLFRVVPIPGRAIDPAAAGPASLAGATDLVVEPAPVERISDHERRKQAGIDRAAETGARRSLPQPRPHVRSTPGPRPLVVGPASSSDFEARRSAAEAQRRDNEERKRREEELQRSVLAPTSNNAPRVPPRLHKHAAPPLIGGGTPLNRGGDYQVPDGTVFTRLVVDRSDDAPEPPPVNLRVMPDRAP